MAIKCGSTGHTHPTVAEVRACQLGGTVPARTAPAPISEVGRRMARSAGIPLSEIEEGRARWREAEEAPGALRTAPSQPLRQATITEPIRTDRSRTAPAQEERKATEPMMRFVNSLIKYRAIDPVIVAETVKRIEAAPDGALPFRMAKLFIDAYKDAPNKPKEEAPATSVDVDLPDVPAGRYALRTDGVVKFYRLDRPEEGKWAGRFFLKAQASDETYPIRNATAKREILERIAEDIEASAVLYGQELGRCYRCGRTLTDELSRSLGIGPDCRSK